MLEHVLTVAGGVVLEQCWNSVGTVSGSVQEKSVTCNYVSKARRLCKATYIFWLMLAACGSLFLGSCDAYGDYQWCYPSLQPI